MKNWILAIFHRLLYAHQAIHEQYRSLVARIKLYAIRRTLRKLSPQSFSYSDPKKIDYYISELSEDIGEGYKILVYDILPEGVYGKLWNGKRFEEETCLPNRFVRSANLEITHFYRYSTIRYSSVLDFFFGEYSLLAKRFVTISRLRNWINNALTRFRKDRLGVLKILVERHIRRASDEDFIYTHENAQDAFWIFRDIYGERVYGHKNYHTEYARFELILDSLSESGDLIKEDNNYRVSGFALKTIADYEEQERRHRDSVWHNRIIAVLTAAIVIASIYDVFLKPT